MGTLAGESFLFPSFFSLFPLFSFFPSDGSFETSCWVGTEGGGGSQVVMAKTAVD